MGGGISSSDLALYDIPLTSSPSQASTDFEQLLRDLQSTSVDPRSVRKAACCAALIETVQERRHNQQQEQQQQQQKQVSPNELFLATLAALTSLQGTLEQQVQSNNDNNNANEVETTALPLLEILRQILPYVAHPSNNHGALLLHQFGTVSRMLRMFVALGYAYTAASSSPSTGTKKDVASSANSSTTSGANALLRQILKTTTMLLLITPPTTSSSSGSSTNQEKEMAKLFHATIIRMFHDIRPKVRKAAFGCAMDVVIVASSSSSSSSSSSPSPLLQQRKVIADFLWEYCHAMITQYKPSSGSSKKNNDSSSASSSSKMLIHNLRLLSTSLPYADDIRIRVRFGDDCLALMGGGGDGGNKKGEVSMEVIRETLITLLSCLEKGEEDGGNDGLMSMEQEIGTTKDTDKEEEEVSKFAARALAFLLQHRPNAANSSFANAGDVNVVYGRCLMGCVERMLVRSNTDDDGILASKLLAMKLLPNVLTSIFHLCDEAAEGDDGATNSAEMCGSEFNQFVSRMIPIVTSYFNVNGNNASNTNLQRVALEAVSNCIEIIQQALKIQYRNAWGNILPGGYATFTSTLALNLLEMRGAGNEANNGNSELESKLLTWLKELVVSLLQLRDDVEKDGTARTSVEYATSTVMRGMGLELFLSLVDFTDDQVDIGNNNNNKKKSLNTASGGGLWWLLPLMKQSASSDTSALTSSSSSITTKSHLSFFQGRVLNLARRCDAASADGHRTAAEASIQKQRVVEVWSLLYYFCLHPIDMKENFAAVAKTVVKALGDHSRYPKLVVSSEFVIF